MRPREDVMTILHVENYLMRITEHKEIENMKATAYDYMLNIIQINNNLLYKILKPLQDQSATGKSTCRGYLIKAKGPKHVIQHLNEERRSCQPDKVNLREKILAWTRIRTRVTSSTHWRSNSRCH